MSEVPDIAPLALIDEICLFTAIRSAEASLCRLTNSPFLPQWGIPSFVKKEAKGRPKAFHAFGLRAAIPAHPALPENGRKM